MYFSFVFNSVGLENNVLFLFSFKFRLVSMPQLKSHPFWCCGCYFCKSIRVASITIFSFFNASFTFYNLNTIHHPVKSFFFFHLHFFQWTNQGKSYRIFLISTIWAFFKFTVILFFIRRSMNNFSIQLFKSINDILFETYCSSIKSFLLENLYVIQNA